MGATVPRTHFEDLLHAPSFGAWDRIDSHAEAGLRADLPLAEPVTFTADCGR